MELEISIEDKAKKFLEEKGNILTIFRMDVERSCVAFEDLEVSYEDPKKGNYEKHQCDDVTVYIQKGIQFKHNRVEIVITGIGPFKNIAVEGLKRSV
ncbi:CC/Se motif family (seleno)protein [Lentibacillus sp. N15]|uniref:CC/Se motif family (seleno)protein n=1 Tax=Lentibacillus songyuanensis TaxID=3136161 RepID=UPI0031BA2098